MPRPRLYSPAQIQLAKELYARHEWTLAYIAQFVGMHAPHAVLYYCEPKYREDHLLRCKKWQEANRDRMLVKQKEYSKKWLAKRKNESSNK